jgi:hypothetical protein
MVFPLLPDGCEPSPIRARSTKLRPAYPRGATAAHLRPTPRHSAHAVETLDLKIVACQGSLAPHSRIKLDIAQALGNEKRSS